jgi:aminomuconate-semialdehyde/2-hydroxymuconate-6-semialdehyde dehydrogenase
MAALLRNYVNGRWVGSGRSFPNIHPVNGVIACKVSEVDQAIVSHAVGAARSAMNGDWGRLSAADRAALLHKVAVQIEARSDDFGAAEILDTGHSYPQAQVARPDGQPDRAERTVKVPQLSWPYW